MNKSIINPKKELIDFLSDSRVWNEFIGKSGFVKGDIIIADPFKAGTTLTQRILEQILNNGIENVEKLSERSPWLDSSWGNHDEMIRRLDDQKRNHQRRVIKSHLPAWAIPISGNVLYIFVGRNGKDIINSLHNYLCNFNQQTIEVIEALFSTHIGKEEKLVIPESSGDFFNLMLETDGYRCCDIYDVVQSWWDIRFLPNVLLVHYRELIDNLDQQILRIADFIGKESSELNLQRIKSHCDFNYMREQSEKLVPFNGKHMKNPKAFFHKGPKRNYKYELTQAQIERFDLIAKKKLTNECYRWLENGSKEEETNQTPNPTKLSFPQSDETT